MTPSAFTPLAPMMDPAAQTVAMRAPYMPSPVAQYPMAAGRMHAARRARAPYLNAPGLESTDNALFDDETGGGGPRPFMGGTTERGTYDVAGRSDESMNFDISNLLKILLGQ